MSQILVQNLGLNLGDVHMVDETGQTLKSTNCKSYIGTPEGESCYYLKVYRNELNKTVCDETSFKLVSKIMINACSVGLKSNEVSTRLFPSGSGNAQTLYRAFTGQPLRTNESKILQDLASTFGEESEKRVALCAAVASSFAATSVY